ncbi:MAG: putative peptidyl-prolyl cis-trans isomerase [Polyangiaceae bacterium]|nr:putative peptidyl-prolyl cis-trans isomerase [Polyangiaceae bacterium]
MKQALVSLLLALCSCEKSAAPADAGRTQAPARPPALGNLLQAELRRDPSGVSEEERLSPRVEQRREAIRTLARIADPKSFEPLAQALADEDAEVMQWAAFGVGQLCRDHEPEAVRRLALRAASLATEPASDTNGKAWSGIAFALGRCASDEAERTLRSWLRLRAPLAASATLGIAQVARSRKRLDDATIAALLDAASKEPSGAALHPLESLPALGAAARDRLLEVGSAALLEPSPGRAHAVRALAKAGAGAATPLRRLLDSKTATDAERADAARSLAALGSAGQAELAGALPAQTRALIDGKSWLTSAHGVLLTLLEGLESAKGADAASLSELSELPLEGETAPVLRRKIMLRCRAAALLAGRSSLSPTLLACDPSPPAERREGSLATLKVLARGPLTEARGARFVELARAEDRVVREAALELLVAHDEAPRIPELLESALLAEAPGVRATAAKVIARYPARAQLPSEVVAPGVVQALSKRLMELDVTASDVEVSASLLDAAASLSLLGAKPALERACRSPNPTLRKHAERAYAQLGEPGRRCENVPGAETWTAVPLGRQRLELETDVGPLSITLWGDKQPFAATRLVELSREGFFDGMAVHRVVPGFVAQFGDPDGDGFGGPKLPPLRCQTSPDAFEAGRVGVALAGRDTGVSQFFVTLRAAPHLAGEYSQIGEAEGGWDRLAAGDRILRVRVLEVRSAK